MKYLKILFSVLFILSVVFVGRGLFTPHFEYNSEITVDKPIKESWAVMQDESKIKE